MTVPFPRLKADQSFSLTSLIGVTLLVITVLATGIVLIGPSGRPPHRVRSSAHTLPVNSRITVELPPPDLYRPLTPEQAIIENGRRAPTSRPDTPALAFTTKSSDEDSRGKALECLTQAVYYEAASESLDGQRAVAQVVLNRVHHPAYPASVCGVVYQGSERTSGCQFSFTCDGSLRRTPASGLWLRARKLASEALAGKVYSPVGHATYYHADYVVPYWADSLDKEIQIGRHIFYRLKGSLGTKQAFVQRYRGQEPSPLSPTDLAVVDEAVAKHEAGSPFETGLTPLTSSAAPAKPAHPVLADLTHGDLLADEGHLGLFPSSPRPPSSSVNRSISCPAIANSMALKVAATDNRLGVESGNSCH